MSQETSGNHQIPIPDRDLYEWVVHERQVSQEDISRCLDLQKRRSEEGRPLSLAQAFIELNVLPRDQIDRIARGFQAAKALQIPGYEILGLLGTGAMAMVFKARQTRLDRPVAIKVLPQKLSQNAEYVRLFEAEGRAAAKLNHPNIVQAIDVIEASGRHFFVMEYVEGHTLNDEIEHGKIFEEKQALKLIIQVAEALEHAHSQGIIHRDVKPKNIMITPEGVCKLADMGLARINVDQARIMAERGRTIGTPFYMAPEQIRGDDVDFRCDIYSLGGTLYHLVTGHMPFEGEDEREIMDKHLSEPLTPPDHVNPKLSAGLGEVVEVMMAKAPDDRYQSTNALLTDLRAIAAGKPPVLARSRIEADMLDELAKGESAPVDRTELAMPVWVPYLLVVLGVALAISVILNIVLLSRH